MLPPSATASSPPRNGVGSGGGAPGYEARPSRRGEPRAGSPRPCHSVRLPLEERVPLTPQQLARLCHEADRVLCSMQGDARVSPWETLDEKTQDEVVAAVREVLEHPELTDEARHARWLRQRREAGWIYGPVRSIPGRTDPALLEYGALSSERLGGPVPARCARTSGSGTPGAADSCCPVLGPPVPVAASKPPWPSPGWAKRRPRARQSRSRSSFIGDCSSSREANASSSGIPPRPEVAHGQGDGKSSSSDDLAYASPD